MRIVKSRPPNFDKIVAAIPAAAGEKVMFTYGDAIYVPNGADVPPWLIAHEQVHSLRQGQSPDVWWDRYLSDRQFRFTEELVAHRIEWITWVNGGTRNRHDKRGMMKVIAGRLSGPLYGRQVSFDAARTMILADPSPWPASAM